jgi:hypothetical protein
MGDFSSSTGSASANSHRPRKRRWEWAWALLAVTVVILIPVRGCIALPGPADESAAVFPGVPHAGSLPDGEYQMLLEDERIRGGAKFGPGTCDSFVGLVYTRPGKEELGKYRFGCADWPRPQPRVDVKADSLLLRVEGGKIVVTDVVRQRGVSVYALPDGDYHMKEIKSFFRFQVDDKCSHSGIVYDGTETELGLYWILGESYTQCPTREVSDIAFSVDSGKVNVQRVSTHTRWDDASTLPDGDYFLVKRDGGCNYKGSVVDAGTNTDLGLYFILNPSFYGLTAEEEDCPHPGSGAVRFAVENGEVLVDAALPVIQPTYPPKPSPDATS